MRNYLLFCLKATNQHGVHSPFIFSFVTRCLYNKHLVTPADFPQTTSLTTKQYTLLLKSIRYFQPKHIFTDEPLLQEAMTASANLNTTLQQNSYDYLFINGNYATYVYWLSMGYSKATAMPFGNTSLKILKLLPLLMSIHKDLYLFAESNRIKDL